MRTPRCAAPIVVCESRAFPAPARLGPAPSQRANEVFGEDLRLFRQRARARPIAAADRSFRLLDEAANLGYKVRLRRCELAPFRASQIPLGNCQAVLRLLLGLGHIF